MRQAISRKRPQWVASRNGGDLGCDLGAISDQSPIHLAASG
jgi:hypothetical protein